MWCAFEAIGGDVGVFKWGLPLRFPRSWGPPPSCKDPMWKNGLPMASRQITTNHKLFEEMDGSLCSFQQYLYDRWASCPPVSRVPGDFLPVEGRLGQKHTWRRWCLAIKCGWKLKIAISTVRVSEVPKLLNIWIAFGIFWNHHICKAHSPMEKGQRKQSAGASAWRDKLLSNKSAWVLCGTRWGETISKSLRSS